MPTWLADTLAGFWNSLAEMAPYLLFGFLVAGALSVLIRPETVERHLGGRGLWPVIKAAAFGVPLPLCSCGVIPVSASLRKHGASRGATTAFLLSTPQTGVDSILVTWSLLGPVFAIFRPIAAFLTGIFGGALVDILVREEPREDAPGNACQDECCAPGARRHWLVRMLAYGFVTLPRDLARALLVGLLVAGIISAIVPDNWVKVAGTGFVGMLVMMAIGIPLYVCATASVPIAATLMSMGASPGAALVFLMTGPATNAATIAIVWKVMGKRTAGIYLGTVAGTSLGLGALLDLIYVRTGATLPPHIHEMAPSPLQIASAIALLAVLAVALFWRPGARRGEPSATEGAESVELTVQGMSCSHCVQAVTRALRECPGVASADVDLASGRAVVGGSDINVEALMSAMATAGYPVTPLKGEPIPGQMPGRDASSATPPDQDA